MQLAFDAGHTLSYGYYRCKACSHTFYGGGDALHERGCTTPGYENCVYVLGPKAIQSVQEWARTHGDDDPTPLIPVCLNDIREQLQAHLV